MDWLKTQYTVADHFTPVLGLNPQGIPGNGIQPGEPGNLLSEDQQGWYQVTLLNNPNDPGGASVDTDSIVIIQVTGHGPNGAMRRLEWEVHKDDAVNALALVAWRDLF
jgi:hypothetical protein